jgi:hypothetical protein
MAPPAAYSRTPLLVDDEMDYQAIGQYILVVVNAIPNLVDPNPGSGIPLLPKVGDFRKLPKIRRRFASYPIFLRPKKRIPGTNIYPT